ncbi:hypothetical protein ACFQ0M_00265 [Kitasatospora aburaviensis]
MARQRRLHARGWGSSSIVTGPTRTNAYCNWGNVEYVSIEHF